MNYTKNKRTVGSKKNFGKTPKNVTTKKTNFKNPLANIPAFMIPEIIQTKSSNFAVAESGSGGSLLLGIVQPKAELSMFEKDLLEPFQRFLIVLHDKMFLFKSNIKLKLLDPYLSKGA